MGGDLHTMKLHMKLTFRSRGYTIVEAMIAISLIMLAVAAAASISMTIVRQEEVNARAGRAMNWEENAVRLYHLGLGANNDPTAIVNIMPVLPNIVSFTGSPSTLTFAGTLPAGDDTITVTDLTLVYRSDDASATNRTSVVRAVRH